MDMLMTILSGLAASVLAWRGLVRLNAMHVCSPHLIRVSAYLMAVSAAAVVLGALGNEHEYVEWGRTGALLSVALHILCDRRGRARRLEPMRTLA